jgi:hypothetical protein
MKTLWASVCVLAACQAAPPPTAPAKVLDPQDPKSVVEHAVARTRGQKSYEVGWTARLKAPQGDPLDYKGTCVWAAPGILYLEYTASGGDDKKIVRIGDQPAWICDLVQGWQPADVMGFPGAGRGFQNPGKLTLVKPGQVELVLTGDDLQKLMAEQAQQGSFEWSKSAATALLTTDAEGRLGKLECKASLVSTDPNVKGEVAYAAALEARGYNAKSALEFKDEKNRPIALKKPMVEAIEKLRKENP